MAFLTREQVHSIDDSNNAILFIEEWNADVKIKSMNVRERIEFEELQLKCKTHVDSMVLMVMMTCVDEAGQRLFDNKKDLEDKSPVVLMKLFEGAVELNSLTKGKVEEQAKNS